MTCPDFLVINKTKYHSCRQLINKLGWLPALIASELGDPDLVQSTRWGDRKLYQRARVLEAQRNSVVVARRLADYWQAKAIEAARRGRCFGKRIERLVRTHGRTRLQRELIDYD